ncbi:MAG: Zn(2+)-responsive transcriptional regulator [Gammaproteobacteria bacterium]|nr:Zn(2+)-responsive transcriptional regulator [Gammaproteobacteria bacterium]
MKIGELSKKSGLSAHTLRFYEKQGLIKASGRSESNYRIYNSDDLGTARFVKRSRDMGFSLDEVETFLSIRADKPAHICADAKNITELKITEVEQKIAELQQMLVALHKLSDACCGGKESAELCSIIDALEENEGALA